MYITHENTFGDYHSVQIALGSPPASPSSLSTALIAGAAGLAGVLVTAVASVVVARFKTREIQIAYEQKLQDSYLENARAYTNSVYAPLGVMLHKLSTSYKILQAASYSDPAVEVFRQSCRSFREDMSALMVAAAGVFLTVELEQTLEEFEGFIRDSTTASAVKRQRVLTINESSIFVNAFSDLGVAFTQIALMIVPVVLPIRPRAQVFVRRSKVLFAPVASVEFEERFVSEVSNLRRLIKEVTLGAAVRTS